MIIRVTHVTSGDPHVPVAYFAAGEVSQVHFETVTGSDPERVTAGLYHLSEGVINPRYDPLTGQGSFLTLHPVPDIASYEVEENDPCIASAGRPDPDDSAGDDDWEWLPEDLLSAARPDAAPACGWEQLCQLAGMEGELLAMNALQRIRGGLDDPLRRQMYITAAGYVDFMHVNRHALTPQAAALAREVDDTGCNISARDWRWCLNEMAYVYRRESL